MQIYSPFGGKAEIKIKMRKTIEFQFLERFPQDWCNELLSYVGEFL